MLCTPTIQPEQFRLLDVTKDVSFARYIPLDRKFLRNVVCLVTYFDFALSTGIA